MPLVSMCVPVHLCRTSTSDVNICGVWVRYYIYFLISSHPIIAAICHISWKFKSIMVIYRADLKWVWEWKTMSWNGMKRRFQNALAKCSQWKTKDQKKSQIHDLDGNWEIAYSINIYRQTEKKERSNAKAYTCRTGRSVPTIRFKVSRLK